MTKHLKKNHLSKKLPNINSQKKQKLAKTIKYGYNHHQKNLPNRVL